LLNFNVYGFTINNVSNRSMDSFEGAESAFFFLRREHQIGNKTLRNAGRVKITWNVSF